MDHGKPARRALRRVSRKEAAKILGTSRENVRYMQQRQQLRGEKDRRGHYWFDRHDVEELARRRGLQIKPLGELAARVFAMIKANHTFEDIVIQTTQHPDVITGLWKRYYAGFRGEAPTNDDEERKRREHEEQMREMDREIERRRQSIQSDDEPPPPSEDPDSRP